MISSPLLSFVVIATAKFLQHTKAFTVGDKVYQKRVTFTATTRQNVPASFSSFATHRNADNNDNHRLGGIPTPEAQSSFSDDISSPFQRLASQLRRGSRHRRDEDKVRHPLILVRESDDARTVAGSNRINREIVVWGQNFTSLYRCFDGIWANAALVEEEINVGKMTTTTSSSGGDEVVSWEGDRMISTTDTLSSDGTTVVRKRVERYLSLRDHENDGIAAMTDDPLVMNVTTITSEIPSSNYDEERTITTVSQIYKRRRAYNDTRISPLVRVPNCVANVRVRVVLSPSTSQLRLEGAADALLSRGLLAILARAVSELTPEEVLALEADSVAESLGLRDVLSRGRNDGLASMVRVVQDLLRGLLFGTPPPMSTTTTTPISTSRTDENESEKPTVAVLLSGGVDSSVALHLLLLSNRYRVTAFYLKIWLEDELSHLGTCPWEDDYAQCVAVCARAGVPLESLSLQEEYQSRVMAYTLREAERGRTPNPDIMCNSRVKFGVFYDLIVEGRGFDFVASGHYARVERRRGGGGGGDDDSVVALYRAPDDIKDQSYFLAALTQSQLRRVLFPLGNYAKSQVRELAREFDLPNQARPDSQGLCFLGKIKFDDFLRERLGTRPGDIVDAATREVLGRHEGLWFHTVGQRKGIGKVLLPTATCRGPWYVVAKDVGRNVLLLSNRYDEEAFSKARREFYVEDIRWIRPQQGIANSNKLGEDPLSSSSDATTTATTYWMKIRHGPRLVRGSLELFVGGDEGKVVLEEKDGGLAPGQFVVYYSDDGECLGAGVISERHWATFLAEAMLPQQQDKAVEASVIN